MGELEGCWATPSTVSPQAPQLPALPLLQVTGNPPGVLRAHLLFLLFCCKIQLLRRCSPEPARANKWCPLLGAVRHLGNSADCLTSLLLVPFLLEVGVQGSGVFPVLLLGLGGGLRRLRTGLIS